MIARKLVWPNAKHFRLLWPKSWWPAEAVPPPPPQPTSTDSFSSAGLDPSLSNTTSAQTDGATVDGERMAVTPTSPSSNVSTHDTTGTPLLTRSHSDTPMYHDTSAGKMSKKMKKHLEATKSFQSLVYLAISTLVTLLLFSLAYS